MHNQIRFECGNKPDRKRMHHKIANSRKIPSPRKDDGKLFQGPHSEHIDRNKNVQANELVKASTQKIALPPDVFFHTIEDATLKIVESEPRLNNAIKGGRPVRTYNSIPPLFL
jgi:hypothetical protein